MFEDTIHGSIHVPAVKSEGGGRGEGGRRRKRRRRKRRRGGGGGGEGGRRSKCNKDLCCITDPIPTVKLQLAAMRARVAYLEWEAKMFSYPGNALISTEQ